MNYHVPCFPQLRVLNLLVLLAAVVILSACTSSNINDGLRPAASVGTQNTLTAEAPPSENPSLLNPAPVNPAPLNPAPHNPGTQSGTQAGTQIEASQLQSGGPVALLPIDAPLPAAPTASPVTAAAPSPGVIFLPVVGPPQSAVSRLSSAVKNSARNNAVTIIPNGQPGASYRVKGYFSALDDGTGTRFIYIWDVLDTNGRNIYRISGEERTTKRGSDPWSAVDSGIINTIVERTMQNLSGWMSTRA